MNDDDAGDEVEVIKTFKTGTNGYRVELVLAEDDALMIAVTYFGKWGGGEAIRFFPGDIWELDDEEDDDEIQDAFDEASEDWGDNDVRELLADFGYDEHGNKT